MKLVDLNPSWVGYGGEGVRDVDGSPIPRREATAISFDCPCGCEHRVCVRFSNPADGLGPISSAGTSWERSGETFENLTLTPSIQREYPNPCWHGFVTNGEIVTV